MGKQRRDVNGHLIVRDSKGRFKTGTVGNPNGRPKVGQTLTGMLRQVACMSKNGKPNKRLLAEKLFELALDGSIPAARLILEYVDGKPVPKTEGSTRSGIIDMMVREIVVEIPTGDRPDVIDLDPVDLPYPKTTAVS